MSMMRPGGPPGPRGPMGGGGPPGMSMIPSAEKAKDLRGAVRRFAPRLRPERGVAVFVFILGIASVFLTVLGPKLLGNATNIIFAGVISQKIPPGVTPAEAVARLRGAGQGTQADMLASMTLTPGQGVDFAALARLLAIVAVIYFFASVLSWGQNYLMAGVTQRTMFRLREEVDFKLGRLPLSYFDTTP